MKTKEYTLHTEREGLYDVTAQVREAVRESGVQSGAAAVSYTHLDVYKRQVKGIAPLDVGTTRRPVRGQKGRTTRMGFPPLLNFPAFLITVSATASTPGGAGKPRQRLLPPARAVTRAWTVSDRRYPFSHCPVLTSARIELPQQPPYFFGAVLVRNRNGAAVPASGLCIREKG